MRRFVVIAAIGAVLLASCGSESKQQTTAEPQKVSVETSNYKFAAPESVPSGAVALRLNNAGPEPHQANVFKLNDGVDAGKVMAAAKADSSGLSLNSLGAYEGGPDAVDKGESQVVNVNLAPGRYAFMCLVPDAKGRAHAGLGMVKEFTVTAGNNGATEPAADSNASIREFDFTLPAKWQGSVKVTNVGKQKHEYQVMEIAPGKTASDFEKFFKSPPGQEPAGPPPWTTAGGISPLEPGTSQTFDVDLKPGTYYLMCFVADPQRKAPHFALGMLKKFEVK